ncbi:MAG: chromosome segregation protein SMC [Clostridia bacterium]|nr:chromosome segregation protein SMC [Clostridia bacterium]
MQLKRIEIQGFKSFADKTIIEFDGGITTIVGPNGSGKSNISDAVRWVLGEQSAKSLRGSKMEDVIFAGTKHRKMLGLAEVSLILDNTDHSLNVEFDEVVVTRRVYRSGDSEYLINKSQVRLKDVQELFMDTGVGRDGYSIIGQGKIDSIISSKSEDRRNIFEEASGIVKYRTRKEEAVRKLQHTTDNLSRVTDILTEINNNLEPLAKKAETAKKYLELKGKLKDIDVKLFLNVIDSCSGELEALNEKIDAIDTSIVEKEGELLEAQRASDDARVCLEELLQAIELSQETYYSSLNEVDRLTSKVEAYDDRVSLNKENIAKLKEEIAGSDASIAILEQEIVTRTGKKDNLEKNKTRFETELNEKTAELKEITAGMSERELEIEELKRTVESLKENISELKLKIATAQMHLEANNKRLDTIAKDASQDISSSDGIKIHLAEVEDEFAKVEKNRNTLKEQMDTLSHEKVRLEEFFATFTDKENEFKQKILETRSKLNYMLNLESESEGYTRSVKSIIDLSRRNAKYTDHVFGTLASLITTDEKYEKSIEIAMGGYIQNIVVDKDIVAKDLVNFLKDGMLGRATFLPIESIRLYKEDIPAALKKEQGYIGTAMELVSYDKKFEAVARLALGRTVVVDTIENGIKIYKVSKNSAKIVTLAGEVIATTGSITGGQAASKQMTLVGRGRRINEYKERLSQLEKEYAKHLDSIKREQGSYTEIVAKLETVTTEYTVANTNYSVIQERLNQAIKDAEKIKDMRKNKEAEKVELEASNKDLQWDITETNKKIDEIQSEISKHTEEIAEYARFNKEKEERVNFLNEDIMNLKVSLSSFDESALAIDEMVDKIRGDIASFMASMDRKKELIVEYENELATSEARNEEDKKEIEVLKQKADGLKQEIDKLKQDKANNISKQSELEKTTYEAMKTLEKLRTEKTKLDNKKEKYDNDTELLKIKMWEEYEITVSLARELDKALDSLKDISKTKLEQMANKLKSEIKGLGEVTVSAIEEYKELSERGQFITKQKEDLEETKAKLENLIDNTTAVMKTQFAKQFKEINENFKEVFKELFGGGRAELKLSDEKNVLESGIEIEAEPPGKKLQNMSLLSGGEKALTAIAILFAILKIKAPPFCVLDEIEAALDDINVARFASYLEKYSDETQFIVITHRKGTMEVATSVYGVTMQEYGVSKLVSMKMK